MAESWDDPGILTGPDPAAESWDSPGVLTGAPPDGESWDAPGIIEPEPAKKPLSTIEKLREVVNHDPAPLDYSKFGENFQQNFAMHRQKRKESGFLQTSARPAYEAVFNAILDVGDVVKSGAEFFDPKLEKTRAAAQKAMDLMSVKNYAAAGLALETAKTLRGHAPIQTYLPRALEATVVNPLRVAFTGEGDRPWGSEVMKEFGIENELAQTGFGFLFDMMAPGVGHFKGPGSWNSVGRAATRFTSVLNESKTLGTEMPKWSELAKAGDREAKLIAKLIKKGEEGRLIAGNTLSEKIARGQVHFPFGGELSGGLATIKMARPRFKLTEDGVTALMDKNPELVPKDFHANKALGRVLTKQEANKILELGDDALDHLEVLPGKGRPIPLPFLVGGGAETPPLPAAWRGPVSKGVSLGQKMLREYNPGDTSFLGNLRKTTALASYEASAAFHKYPRPIKDTGKLEDAVVWEQIKYWNRMGDVQKANKAGEVIKQAKQILTVSPAEAARARAAEAKLTYVEKLFEGAKDLPVEMQKRLVHLTENPLLAAVDSTDPVVAYMLRHFNTYDPYTIKAGFIETYQRASDARARANQMLAAGDKAGAQELFNLADEIQAPLDRSRGLVRDNYILHIKGVMANETAGANALKNGQKQLAQKYMDRAEYLRQSFSHHEDLYRGVLFDDGGGGGGGGLGLPGPSLPGPGVAPLIGPPPAPSGWNPGRLNPTPAAEQGAAVAQEIQQVQAEMEAIGKQSQVIIEASAVAEGSPAQAAQIEAQLDANNKRTLQLQQVLQEKVQKAQTLEARAANEVEIEKITKQVEDGLKANSDAELAASIADMEDHPAMKRPATALKSVREERAGLSADQREALQNQTIGDYLKQRYGETPDDYAARLEGAILSHERQAARKVAKAKVKEEIQPILEKPQGPPVKPPTQVLPEKKGKGGLTLAEVRKLTEENSDIIPPKGYKPGRDLLAETPGASVAYGSRPDRSFPVKHRIVALEDIVASHDLAGNINPEHPAKFQPRNRSRLGSMTEIKIQGGPGRFIPGALLDDFKTLDRGAPLISVNPETGKLEGVAGHGRKLIMDEAASQNHDAWKAYQDKLAGKAAENGVDDAAAQIEAIRKQGKTPVQVREILDRADAEVIAQDSNVGAPAKMGDAEQAVQDASAITTEALADFTVGDAPSLDAAILATSNRTFVRSFLHGLPENELDSMLDTGGDLSLGGIRRIRSALIARAFPGETGRKMVEAFVESQDSGVKLAEKGIMAALPDIGKVEGLIEKGARPATFSITSDVAKAVDVLARLRAAGKPVEQYLSAGLFARETTDFQEEILRFLDRNSRSALPLTDAISDYARAVEALPNEGQVGLFGEAKQVTKEELWNEAVKKAEGTAEERKLLAAQRKAKPPELNLAGAPEAPAAAADAEGAPRLAEGAGRRGLLEDDIRRQEALRKSLKDSMAKKGEGALKKAARTETKARLDEIDKTIGDIESELRQLELTEPASNPHVIEALKNGKPLAPEKLAKIATEDTEGRFFNAETTPGIKGGPAVHGSLQYDSANEKWAISYLHRFPDGDFEMLDREYFDNYTEGLSKLSRLGELKPMYSGDGPEHLTSLAWRINGEEVIPAPGATIHGDMALMPPDKQALIDQGARVEGGFINNQGDWVSKVDAEARGLKMQRPAAEAPFTPETYDSIKAKLSLGALPTDAGYADYLAGKMTANDLVHQTLTTQKAFKEHGRGLRSVLIEAKYGQSEYGRGIPDIELPPPSNVSYMHGKPPATGQGGAGIVSFMGTGHFIDMGRNIPKQVSGIFKREPKIAGEFADHAVDQLMTFTPDMWNRYKAVRDLFDSLIYTEAGRGELVSFIKDYYPRIYESMVQKDSKSALRWLMGGVPEGPLRQPGFARGRTLEGFIKDLNAAHETVTGKKLVSDQLVYALLKRPGESIHFQAAHDWLKGVLGSLAVSDDELLKMMADAGVKKIPGPRAAADLLNSHYLMEKMGAAPELIERVKKNAEVLQKFGVYRKGSLEDATSILGVGGRLGRKEAISVTEPAGGIIGTGNLPMKMKYRIVKQADGTLKREGREVLDLSREMRNELMNRTGFKTGKTVTKGQLESWIKFTKTDNGKLLLQSEAEKLRQEIQKAYIEHAELAPNYVVFTTRGEFAKIGRIAEDAMLDPSKSPYPNFLDDWALMRDRGMEAMGDPKTTLMKLEPGQIPHFDRLRMHGVHYYLVPETVVDHINKHIHNMGSSENWIDKGILKPLGHLTQFWKGATTVVVPQYHIRNFMQNVYQSHVFAGMDNMEMYDHAAKAIAGKAGAFVDGNGTTRTYASLRKLAAEYGVVNTGFMGSDVTRMFPGQGGGLIDRSKRVFEGARAAGQKAEDYSRTALFYDGLARGLSPWASAMRVKKFLFDYSELSAFEARVLRPWFPFYTWTRKNLPLQIEAMIQNPGKFGLPLAIQHTVARTVHGRQPTPEEMQTLSGPTQTSFPVVYPNRFNEQRVTGWVGGTNTSTDLLQAFASDENPVKSAGKMALNMLNPFVQEGIERVTKRDLRTGREIYTDKTKYQAVPMYLPFKKGVQPVPFDQAKAINRFARVLSIYNRGTAELHPEETVMEQMATWGKSLSGFTSYEQDFEKGWGFDVLAAEKSIATEPDAIIEHENERRAKLRTPLPPMSESEMRRVKEDYLKKVEEAKKVFGRKPVQ